INVAAGSNGTDAVNVDQLKGVSQSVLTTLGGTGGSVNADGSITGPKYKVGDTDFNTVQEALQAAAQGGESVDALKWDATANS
ncbi:hypothetical protein, partial [Dyella japonica]|uniref:hypothetical protein n=1 Tax=Dyella japonica TaxID=231455 RepID=UPI00062D5CB0